jgi:hypothetical protein
MRKWGEKRAIFTAAPSGVLEGEPGAYVLAELEILNNTKWPWKRGCYFGLVDKDSKI